MKNTVGVRVNRQKTIYFFEPLHMKLDKGTKVIVESEGGEDLGEVIITNRLIDEDKILEPLRKIIRIATRKRY